MILHLQVKANSKIDRLFVENDLLKAKINAPALDGKANKYLIALIAKKLKIPKSDITLLKGESNPYKTLELAVTEADVLAIFK